MKKFALSEIGRNCALAMCRNQKMIAMKKRETIDQKIDQMSDRITQIGKSTEEMFRLSVILILLSAAYLISILYRLA